MTAVSILRKPAVLDHRVTGECYEYLYITLTVQYLVNNFHMSEQF